MCIGMMAICYAYRIYIRFWYFCNINAALSVTVPLVIYDVVSHFTEANSISSSTNFGKNHMVFAISLYKFGFYPACTVCYFIFGNIFQILLQFTQSVETIFGVFQLLTHSKKSISLLRIFWTTRSPISCAVSFSYFGTLSPIQEIMMALSPIQEIMMAICVIHCINSRQICTQSQICFDFQSPRHPFFRRTLPTPALSYSQFSVFRMTKINNRTTTEKAMMLEIKYWN